MNRIDIVASKKNDKMIKDPILNLDINIKYQEKSRSLIEQFNQEQDSLDYLINGKNNIDDKTTLDALKEKHDDEIRDINNKFNNNFYVKLWDNHLKAICYSRLYTLFQAIIIFIIIPLLILSPFIIPIPIIAIVSIMIILVIVINIISLTCLRTIKSERLLKDTKIHNANQEYEKLLLNFGIDKKVKNQDDILNKLLTLHSNYIEFNHKIYKDLDTKKEFEKIQNLKEILTINKSIADENNFKDTFKDSHKEDIEYIESIKNTIKNYDKKIEELSEQISKEPVMEKHSELYKQIIDIRCTKESEELFLNSDVNKIQLNRYKIYTNIENSIRELNIKKVNLWNSVKNIPYQTYARNRDDIIIHNLIDTIRSRENIPLKNVNNIDIKSNVIKGHPKKDIGVRINLYLNKCFV